MTLQDGIALGVRDDGSNADGAEIKQRISDLGRNSVVTEFDKQILPLGEPHYPVYCASLILFKVLEPTSHLRRLWSHFQTQFAPSAPASGLILSCTNDSASKCCVAMAGHANAA